MVKNHGFVRKLHGFNGNSRQNWAPGAELHTPSWFSSMPAWFGRVFLMVK